MIQLLIYLVVVALVIGLAYYIVDAIPVPEPLGRIIKIAVVVIGALIVILVLLDLAGMNTGFRGPVLRP